MSRARSVKYALPIFALLTNAACATTEAEPQVSAEEQAYKDAIELALKPATPEEIAQAERSDPITRANFWAAEYQKDPANAEVTVRFMNALRKIGSHERVAEIASAAIPIHPTEHELLLELGRSFMAQERFADAAQAFARSADLSPPTDAAPLAALGLAFDRLEDHTQAQEAYELALEREPNRVSTLSNYGLSLALTGQISAAETALRRAVEAPGADGRVRQNLALILGLQGRFDEMVSVDPNAPIRTVEANQTALREMMVPVARSYDNLQQLDDVIDDVERTPAAPQSMPDLEQADVEDEAMADPQGLSATDQTELAGESPARPANGLRPKLRGSQNR
ncbi:MAG: tetratricopeptide repeat protein [Pseudomonadota bacterium]